MTVQKACEIILGQKAAKAIADDMGEHWTVVAAMAAATTAHPKIAVHTLREYVRNQKHA